VLQDQLLGGEERGVLVREGVVEDVPGDAGDGDDVRDGAVGVALGFAELDRGVEDPLAVVLADVLGGWPVPAAR